MEKQMINDQSLRNILVNRILHKLKFCVAATAGIASATTYTYVPIPASSNIQTALISAFPVRSYTASNSFATPFQIGSAQGSCGPSKNSPCNFYDGFTGVGSSITMNVSVSSPTDVYTLMNAYYPPVGQQLATIEFVGTGNTSLTFALIGGQDIRDFYQGSYANGLSNGVAGVTAENTYTCTAPSTCLGGAPTGNVQTGDYGIYVVDEQDFSLGSVFTGQTLTKIILTDTYSGSTPILLGATVGAATMSPEPGSLACAGLALFSFSLHLWWRRRSKRAY